MGQDRGLEPLQLRARVQPVPVGQGVTGRPVGLQRVRLAAAPVQGHHQLPPQSLPEPVLADQHLQLSNQFGMEAEGELRLDTVLNHVQAEML